ncbi:MAG: PhnD/SsuA/transferrin family substrate-binding protein, partial [Pseudomonadota bacterium]
PMYDWPELRAETDALWSAIRARLGRGPEALERGAPAWAIWQGPDLMLSQTCGWPLSIGLAGRAEVVAAPVVSVPGASPGTYRSAIVARGGPLAEALAGTVAVNSFDSLSGWVTLARFARRGGHRLGPLSLTGAHRESLAAVRGGRADVAAVDGTCWFMAERLDETAGLEILAWTDPAPAPPFITAPGRCEGAAEALDAALRAPEAAGFRAATGLLGARPAGAADYAGLPGWAAG